jgi:hypothetical protein
MVEIIWEFVVKEKARGQFELAYGPGGAWSTLFGRSPGFRGTTLLRDTRNPRRYLTVDFWETAAQREQVLAELTAEYSKIDAAFAEWTESRAEVGIFSVLAEGTVRPRGAPGRINAGDAGRRSRRTTR